MTGATDWIDCAPSHWTRGRIKDMLTSVKNGVYGDDPTGHETDVALVRAADFDRAHQRVNKSGLPKRSIDSGSLRQHGLNQGDLVLEKSGGGEKQPVGMAVLYDQTTVAVCSNFCARIVPASSIDPRFLTYAFSTAYAQGLTQSAVKQTTGIQNLDTGAFLASRWAHPDEEEQRRIADFLDAETARIDRLSTSRKQQFAVAQERVEVLAKSETGRYALRQGSLPTAWNRQQMRRCISMIRTGSTPPTTGPSFWNEDEEGVPWYGPSSVHNYLRISNPVRRVTPAAIECGIVPRFPRGSVLVIGIGATAGKVTYLDHDATGNQQVTAILPAEGLVGRFLAWQLWAATDELRDLAPYTTLPIINNEFLKCFPMALPSRVLQERIASRLDAATSQLSSFEQASETVQSLLAERRQALITAAVTGQLDVSTASGRGVTEGVGV